VGNALRPGDLLITLGAGNVHEVGSLHRAGSAGAGKTHRVLEANGGGVARLYEPMNRHTTYLIGGPAQYWIGAAHGGGLCGDRALPALPLRCRFA
jgi:UDP-N-acetylmuramate--alanine ligase